MSTFTTTNQAGAMKQPSGSTIYHRRCFSINDTSKPRDKPPPSTSTTPQHIKDSRKQRRISKTYPASNKTNKNPSPSYPQNNINTPSKTSHAKPQTAHTTQIKTPKKNSTPSFPRSQCFKYFRFGNRSHFSNIGILHLPAFSFLFF